MDWLQSKYIGLVSVRLRNYKQRGASFNFSCPICGDSHDNKSRARGYIYEYKGYMKFHCHNCGADMTAEHFLKEIDPGLYGEYCLEKMRERGAVQHKFLDEAPKKYDAGTLKLLRSVDKLPTSHPCRQLVETRRIPAEYYSKLYFTPNFKDWVNTIIPEKFTKSHEDDSRLVIPFCDKTGRMHAFQGRTIIDGDKRTKYIMIVTDESVPSLYGMDTARLNKRTYVFEGPIDSMFINNSIATGGGDFHTRLHGLDRENLVLVYDNEPRSPFTKTKMIKALRAGYTISIWPHSIEQKDVNEMILSGLSAEYIQYTIDNHIVTGVIAGEVAVKRWSQC